MKPTDRIGVWEAQTNVMRAENCCLFLRQILPETLYLEVRKSVCQWDLVNDPEHALSEKMQAAVTARWAS